MGRPRKGSTTKSPSGLEMQMRSDGFVPAAEIAAALAMHLSTVHRQLDAGTMPGTAIAGGRANVHWFVDARKLLASGVYRDSPTATRALRRIVDALEPARQSEPKT